MMILSACVSTPVYTPAPEQTALGPGDPLFQQGEQFFARNDFDRALAIYSRYLSQYPQGERADQALYRIGSIYRQKGMADASQAFYQRLVTEFPQSALVNDARLAVFDLLMLNKKTDDAIAQAEAIFLSNPDDRMRRQLWQRLARHHHEAGENADSAAYVFMLYESAPEEEKIRWLDRLYEVIGRLQADDIDALWDQMDDDLARSHLMYRYATLQVVQENYDEALEVLIAFLEAYPNHVFAADASQIIDTLEQRLSFTPQTLGCLLPLSGRYRLYGQQALNGIELALSLMQSSEQPFLIKLVIRDSESEEHTAVQGVKALVEAGVGAIIGPIVTSPAAAREAQKQNVPMVTFTQKPDITEIGDYIFRHFITPQNQVQTLVSYFINSVGLQDFAIMYPHESYGQTFMTLFWEEVIRQGGRVVGVESYDMEQTDFASAIQKLVGTYYKPPEDLAFKSSVVVEETPYFQATFTALNRLEVVLPDPITRLTGLFFQDPDQDRIKGPAIGRRQQQKTSEPTVDFDVLFIPDAPKTAGLILPQLAYHDIKDVYLAGTNLWHSQQLITMTRDYAQNAVMAEGFFSQSPEKPVQQFAKAFKDLYGKEPGIIEAFAFDTAWLLFNLLSQSDVHLRHDLRDVLLQRFEPAGVTGPTFFAENGEAIKKLSLLRIKGGRFFEIPRQ
jgi:ABC-type branched-subunit amino acid transport system substrate-binding protein